MKALLVILFLSIIGCSSSHPNHEYYSINSGAGWTVNIIPDDVKDYVPWK